MAVAIRAKQSQKRRSSPRVMVHKPHGVLHPRVQRVGPERFGIASVDCAKANSKWMLCDFYGKVLIPPTELPHFQGHFAAAVALLREALARHDVRDVIIAVERTGNYHLPVQRAFAAAGFEIRIVHPFATKQFRQPANPGVKTDDNDLAAIFRAAVNGFGLTEPRLDDVSRELQLMARHRRDLVEKRSAVYCQIRERLDAVLPGYAACFVDLWANEANLEIARRFASPTAIREAGVKGLARLLKEAKHRFLTSTLERIVAWSGMAPTPDPMAAIQHRLWLDLDADQTMKTTRIQALERDLARLLVQTPYVLLLSHPGINVVSAAELAGEMGPIGNYASHRAITGRAGLFPSRYQSDAVDLANGELIRCANRSLRAILMLIASNLIKCNVHFRGLAAVWQKQARHSPKWCRVAVASRFSRIAFQIVAGRQVFRHPSCRERDYILDKLLEFHKQHGTSPQQILIDLHAAVAQVPQQEHAAEATPLQSRLAQSRRLRRHGPHAIGDLLLVVLARLGVGTLQSDSRDQDPS
jgi:transposase